VIWDKDSLFNDAPYYETIHTKTSVDKVNKMYVHLAINYTVQNKKQEQQLRSSTVEDTFKQYFL